jgi:hypothetical protein
MMPLVYLSIMVPANTIFYLSFEVWRRFHRPKHAQVT